MPNRTATLVSAAIAGLSAGISLTASIGAIPARAADECLTAPKGETPGGSHWYYRIEHPSNRHCWHLREEGDAQAQTAPSNSPAAAKQAPPKQDAAMPGSVANARAELTSPQARLDRDAPVNTGQVPAAATTANIDSTPTANAPDTNMLKSVVASRWPDQLSASASAAAPPPAPDSPPADAQANNVQANDVQANDVQANDVQTSDMQANQVPPPPTTGAPVPLAAADASMAKQSGSATMLLAVMVGALSIAGLAASAIFRFGGKRRRSRDDLRGEVRPIWDLDRDFRRSDRPLPFPASAVRRPNIGMPLELEEADDAGADRDRIEQMLARLARSTQS